MVQGGGGGRCYIISVQIWWYIYVTFMLDIRRKVINKFKELIKPAT